MALRRAHGKAKALGSGPRIEVLPPNELPAGLPGPARDERPTDRGPGGQFARGNSLAQRGAKAKTGMTRLAHSLGLSPLPAGNDFAPYKRLAVSLLKQLCVELAATVGGGTCGNAASLCLRHAAWQAAASQFWADRAAVTEDVKEAHEHTRLASKLANDSRQNLLAAMELCAREANARPKKDAAPWLRSTSTESRT